MTPKKVQISNILNNLIPDFIESDHPKFKEFLEQYYISEEHTYGTTYLADNLNEFKKISNLVDVSLAEEQTLPPPNALYPTKPIILAVDALAYDSKIYLAHSNTTVNPAQTLSIPVEGLPDTYGLIKIDNEIITYTNKSFDESTGFTELSGCVRGFSGISEIDNPSNPEFLTFLDSNSDSHESGTIIVNLNFIFLNKFYEKHKQQFLPGLEKRKFKQGLSSENILSRAKDFYSSKGTDVSLRILFQVLFGEEVSVVKPFDETIMPSEARWSVTDDMIVEALRGDPLNLVGTKLFQGDEESPTASGAAENVKQVFLGSKKYFKISFVKGSVINEKEPGLPPEFVINSRTKVLEGLQDKSVVTVDSTVGFPEKDGVFYYLERDPNTLEEYYSTVSYGYKSYNQFFDCIGVGNLPIGVGLTVAVGREIPVISGNFLYGYENNDESKVCEMRIVGSVSGVSANVSSTKYFNVDDTIRVKHLGEKTDLNDPKFNKWFYNNISEIEILDLPKSDPSNTSSDTIVTPVNHFLQIGDKIDVFNRDTETIAVNQSGNQILNAEVMSIESDTKFKISDSIIVGFNYYFRKRLDYVSAGFGITSLLGNIQNTFVDSDDNTYLTFSGYPGFDTNTDNGEKTFKSVGVSTETSQITITDHQFVNGEKVYYKAPTTGIGTLGQTGINVFTVKNRMNQIGYGSTFSDGYYYVNKVDDNTIRLCVGQNRVVDEDFELIKYTGISTDAVHSLIPAKLYEGGGLKNQKNFKRIFKTPLLAETNSEIIGPIGVSLNGVELHSPISQDSVFYGPIQKIDIFDSGEGYSVINPPNISVTDSYGSDCELYPAFSGKISKLNLLTQGFDYVDTPTVTISGGNGSGTVCKAKMRSLTHSVAIDDAQISIGSSSITLPTDIEGTQLEHKFLDGEEVIYNTKGSPIGITSTNVGFSTDKLTSSGRYFIAKINNSTFRLAITKDRALNKTKLIEFNALGDKGHTFKSAKLRKIIDEIAVIETGSEYINRNVVVDSQSYPPENKKDLIDTFSGIDTINDCIYAKNHGFKSGEVIEYSSTGTLISGLSTTTAYKIKVIDGHKFKLSSAGTISTVSSTNYDRDIFVNVTGIGTGTHTFKYPDIQVNIKGVVSAGTTSNIPSYYNATADVDVKGSVENVYVKSGGISYGTENIVNYSRQPNIEFLTGSGANLVPIIESGAIIDVMILTPGQNYTSAPELQVVGTGTTQGFARLKANVSGGKITSIDILSGGKNYVRNQTDIVIVPSGKGARLNAEIYEWKLNSVEYYDKYLSNINNDAMVQITSPQLFKGVKPCSFYPGQKYRRIVGDNIGDAPNYDEKYEGHGKIIGWAYDGNPIFGTIGERAGIGVTWMQSSYSIDLNTGIGLRPSLSVWGSGLFIQDYAYKQSGDLDEFNGKFIRPGEVSDFPEGTYAYFSTLDISTKKPSFPYITLKHHNHTDEFNYDAVRDQSDEYINTGEYKRNVTHLGLNQNFIEYPFLKEPLASKVEVRVDSIERSNIQKIDVSDSGSGYNVGDLIKFNDNRVSAEISEVLGEPIVSIATTESLFDNVKFSYFDGKVTGITTIPHSLNSMEDIEISGISSALYRNIEGFRKVGITTVRTNVAVAIGNTTLDTNISLNGSTLSGNFEIDDEIQINAEKMLIIGIDNVNNRYKVSRGYDNTTPAAHSADSEVSKLLKEFTFDINGKFENKNIEFSRVKYFVGESSVGIGSLYTNVVVGTVGSSNINKSIPPRAIYLPGHQFKTGDAVTLVGYGSTIWASESVGLGNTFKLAEMPNLYTVKLSDEFIGLATVRSYIGLSTAHVYFTGIDTYWGDSQKLETIENNITGKVTKVNATVSVAAATTTGSQHPLIVGDNVRLNIEPNRTQYFNFVYNSAIKKIIVNPVSIASTVSTLSESINSGTNGISIAQDEFIIPNNDFETGDIVVYTGSNAAAPLVNNEIYYVIKNSTDTIKLALNEYDLKVFPNNNILLTSAGSGSHQIAKINPQLIFYKGNNVSIAASDASLSGYDINFYADSNFITKINSPDITKTGVIGDESVDTKINISIGSSFPSNCFYKIEGEGSNYMNTYPNSVDTKVVNYSNISTIDSKFNKKHTVTGIGDTTFSFTLVGAAETNSYENTGFSSAFYSTNSKNTKGGVHAVKLISSPNNLNSLPILTSVGSSTGKGVVFDIQSDNIGKIQSVTVPYQGLEFSPDNTLRPKADSNVILNLKNTLTLSKIGISTGGKNYANGPEILAVNKPTIAGRTNLKGGAVDSVDILANDSNLNDTLEIISTNNTNGVGVVNATSEFNITRQQQENKIFIRVPANYAGFTTATFPFKVGENVYVENIDIVGGASSTASGYNSDGYDFKTFEVTAIDVTSDSESVSYSIQGIGNTGGTYDDTNNFGRIIREADLAKFTPEFKKVEFVEGELIKSSSGASGNVSVGGWNSENDVLKVFNIQGEFKEGDIITGTISNFKSIVNSLFVSDFDLKIDSVVESINDWRDDTGKLNVDNQRVHDNDYYQRFSYAIKGDVPYDKWKDPVDSLTHISGFKNFANLGISSTVSAQLKPDADVDVRIDLSSQASVFERPWFDYVTEETDSNKFSKIIKFDNKTITNYNESVTNKVLLVNDISSEFTGKSSTFTGEHRFVNADTDGINKTGGGNLTATTGTAYDPVTGVLTITTTTVHGLSTGDTITLENNSIAFKCSKDNYATDHTYPRKTDPASTSNTQFNNGLLEVTVVDSNTFTVVVNNPITGGQIVGVSTFTLKTNINGVDYSLLHHSFNPATSTNVDDITKHSFNIPNHYFNSGEVIHYAPKTAGNSIGIVTTTVAGIGVTDKLPPTLYAIRDSNENFRVAVSKEDAVDSNGIGVTFITSGGSVPTYGGSGHTFSVPPRDATARNLILVDNIIQSPLARRAISLELSAPVGIGSTVIYVTDATQLAGKSIVQINDEIIKVNSVGIGSTTTLRVTRGAMGTQIGVHTVGAGITALSGDYRIEKGKIHFTTPPYGKSGKYDTSSSFRGRIFYRLDYTDNNIIDDLSDTFTGSASQFTLQSEGTNLPVGISSYFGVILINNIFQRPWYSDLGSSDNNDYIVGTGVTVTFTGSAANGDLPRGGIIGEFTVGVGSGYQIPTRAIATPVVSVAGTIASVAINTAGQGYISSPRVSIGVTFPDGTGSEALLSAHINNAGIVTSITVVNPGSGYTTSNIPTLTIDEPSPYIDIPLTGGSGSNATMDVVVGTGGSIISFDINNRGMGYEVGEELTLSGLPVQAGIGTTAFTLTIENEYKDKFASWNFGKFLEMDDFSELFNGFKKTFLITRTTASKEYYSIDKRAGSGIVLANNLLLFLNDVLQMPGEDYVFDKGTKISFREAPPKGSKFKFYLYLGSDNDVSDVKVDETVKVGDLLQIRAGIDTLSKDDNGNVEYKTLNFPPSQETRTIHELTASDLVNTNTYFGQGILANSDFSRPVFWTKQREDKIIDGLLVSKERDYLEPQIYPATKVTKSFSATDTKIYVEDTYAFHHIDASVGSVLNDVRISGLATAATESWTGRSPFSLAQQFDNQPEPKETLRYKKEKERAVNDVVTSPRPQSEVLQNCTYTGDFGVIIGITTHTSGVGTATPSIKFTIKPDPSIYDPSPDQEQRSVSGITTGDYFVVRNTVIGIDTGGTKSLNTGVNDVISIGNSFIDNIYYANTWVSYAATDGAITVTCNVDSLSGINTLGLTTVANLGTYSWGTINVASRPADAKSFEVNQVGLATDTVEASRTLQIMLESTDIR